MARERVRTADHPKSRLRTEQDPAPRELIPAELAGPGTLAGASLCRRNSERIAGSLGDGAQSIHAGAGVGVTGVDGESSFEGARGVGSFALLFQDQA
jgi:hypothetical protein